MRYNIQDGVTAFLLSSLFYFAFWQKSCNATHQDDICGTSNGRRLYLELGERGVLTAINITLSHGNRPQQTTSTGNLSSHEQCSLELVTCPACIISITFHHLALPHHCGGGNMLMDSPCRCDYVWLAEPPFEDESGVPFCGLLAPTSSAGSLPLRYRSQTRSLAITLLYSESHKHAFSLEYTAERNRQIIKGSPGGGMVVSPSSNMSHSGILTSPFFPAQYPRDLGIEYVITCQSDNNSTCRVRIVFRDFQIATASIMEFYDWNGHRLDVSSGALFRPPVILTTGPSMLVRFYANGGSGLGFKAIYSFITENIQDSAVIPITDCGGNVENMGGAITMMNMVETGAKTYDCVWLIRPPKNYLHLRTHLYLKVATFRDMAGSTELQVLQGLTSEQPVLDTFRYPAALIQSSRHREHVVPVNVGFYVSLRGTFGPISRLAIVYTAFSYMDCFSGPDFLCQNHRCIPSQLSCDGFDHCGDNSDEPNTCYQEWEAEPQDRRWYSHTPNYYFPKMDRYPDLKTATLIFIMSSLGLILLITALILLLYRMGSRARQQRDIQDRLQTISELLDGARMDDPAPEDEPPVYEAPPDYDEVIKVFLEPIENQRHKKKKLGRRSTRRSTSSPGNTVRNGEVSIASEQRAIHPASLLEVVLPDPVTSSAPGLLDLPNGISPTPLSLASRSCQTTPIPDSPPPPYSDEQSTSQIQILSPVSSQPTTSTTTQLSMHGNKLRQSWLLFRQESEEDQLLSVVVTGIAHPASFNENDEFQSIPEPNLLPTISESTQSSNSRLLLQNEDSERQEQNKDKEISTNLSIVPVDQLNNNSPSLVSSPINQFLDSQLSPSIKIDKNCVYRGRILEVKRVPRSLFSFDDMIAQKICQTFPQFGRRETCEATDLMQRRCASHSSLCQVMESQRDSESETYQRKSSNQELKFRSHPQMTEDLNLILETRNKMLNEIPDDNCQGTHTVPSEILPSSCNCDGACGCATITPVKELKSKRKRHHVRSLSAGFPSTSSSAGRSRDLRELDIYFSLHEFGQGDIKPIPMLTCDNSTDLGDQVAELPQIPPHKLWERPAGSTGVLKRQDSTHYIL